MSAPTDAGERYHFSPSVYLLIAVIFGGVGVLLAASMVQSVNEWRLAPAVPRVVSVAEATAIVEPGPVAWVRLSDARLQCERPLQRPSSSYTYGVVSGPTGQRLLVAFAGGNAPLCPAGAAGPFSGRLVRREVGDSLPVGVSWDDFSNEHPDGPAYILWTDWTPPRGVGDFLLGLLIGVFTLFFLAGGAAALWGLFSDFRALRRPRSARLVGVRFRLPLSTGASALQYFSVSYGVAQAVVFGGLFFLSVMPDWLGVIIGVLAGFWVLATFGVFVEGWKRRASDLLLADDACEIRGGPLDGTQHSLVETDADFCRLDEHAPGDDGDILEAHQTLRIRGETAAISHEPSEDRSLRSIAETLQGLASRPSVTDTGPPAIGAQRLAVVHCPGCGAPVPPRLQGACPYCDHAIVLPAAVRQQLQAQAAHEHDRIDSEHLLRKVLRQPPAWRINATLLLFLPPLVLSWPVAGAVFDEFYQGRHVLRPYHGLSLALAALCSNLALGFLLRAQVAARAAVRVIATHFAARPPVRRGAPPDCRVCGAPLPVEAQRLLVLCGYCQAENVTGLNLVPVAAAQADQLGELRGALIERLQTRRRFRRLSLLALLLLGLAGLSLWPVRSALRARAPAPTRSAPPK
ncbi:MAG TPA: hypothetical protein PKI03_31595 [Pseudomonadota bacterium]|nr:hypothetical protein [Pseudomonadota bacterium]